MNKFFIFGFLIGIIFSFVVLFCIGSYISQNSDPIQYLEQPVSYEYKTKTSFKVFQVFEGAALANEISNEMYGWYNGNTVMILGENFYSDQIVTVYNPKRVGTYSYTTNRGIPKTVPVIK